MQNRVFGLRMCACTQVTHLHFLQVKRETLKQLFRYAKNGDTVALRGLLEGETHQLRLAMVRVCGQMAHAEGQKVSLCNIIHVRRRARIAMKACRTSSARDIYLTSSKEC